MVDQLSGKFQGVADPDDPNQQIVTADGDFKAEIEGGFTYSYEGKSFTKTGVPLVLEGDQDRVLGPEEEFSAKPPIKRVDDKVSLLKKGAGPLLQKENFVVNGQTAFLLRDEKDPEGQISLPSGSVLEQEDGRLHISGGFVPVKPETDFVQFVNIGDGKAVTLEIDVALLNPKIEVTEVGKEKNKEEITTPSLQRNEAFDAQYAALKDQYNLSDEQISTFAQEGLETAIYASWPAQGNGLINDIGNILEKVPLPKN